MELHYPFVIGPRLAPAIRLGDSWLSLTDVLPGALMQEDRDTLVFQIDGPDTDVEDDTMMSAVGGLKSKVQAFYAFLSFLGAAVEHQRNLERGSIRDELDGLFDATITDWACEHANEIECATCELSDCGDAMDALIRES